MLLEFRRVRLVGAGQLVLTAEDDLDSFMLERVKDQMGYEKAITSLTVEVRVGLCTYGNKLYEKQTGQ